MRRTSVAMASAVAGSLCLASCATDQPKRSVEIAPMWQAEIDRILDGSPSDLERRALEDGRIDDAEFAEALKRFESCMERLPYDFSISVEDDGSFAIGGVEILYAEFANDDEGQSALDELVAGCERGTTGELARLRSSMLSNPLGRTGAEEVRECFEKHAIPDGLELDLDSFERLINSPEYTPSDPWARSCLIDSQSEVLLGTSGDVVELTVEE